MRRENDLGVGIIADDASHHSSDGITIGVNMNDVLALAKHSCKSHWAIDVTNALEWQNRYWNVHLLELLDDVVVLSTHHLDIEVGIVTHVSDEVTGISFCPTPCLARDDVKNIYHD